MTTPNPASPLPLLRNDIRIEPAGTDADGREILLITDPLRDAFFRLSWPASAYLSCWRNGASVPQLSMRIKERYALDLTDSDLDALIKFLFSSQLTQSDEQNSWGRYASIRQAGKQSLLASLVHNYLFFRLPILRPAAALERLLPRLNFIYSRRFLYIYLIFVCLGLYLTSRQWPAFEAMFWRMAKLQSITLYAAVLLGLKAIHELGHALTTTRYGCRVPTMGIAFMMGAPVFYTDTTEAWRLQKRSQRLAIVVAGVAAEFIVAGIAIFLWPFLPDGFARETCFAITTTTLVTSLLVNLNPCMRFDGYFALSDILNVPNLQHHAFALGRWKLRDILFKPGIAPPEHRSRLLQWTLVLYAWMVWIYRLLLFCGIAVLVYTMTVKVLGILLGLFEIIMFVLRPLVREIREWGTMKTQILHSRRTIFSGASALAALALLFMPWLSVVDAPAMLGAADETALHAAMPARIKRVRVDNGQSVEQGDTLFELELPELKAQLVKARAELQAAEIEAGRYATIDKEIPLRLILESQKTRAQERLDALTRLEQNLTLRAPMHGLLIDLDADALPGIWVSQKQELARIIAPQGLRARGLVTEADLARIHQGSSAAFIPETPLAAAVPLRLASIAPMNQSGLSEPALAETYGGSIATSEEHGSLVPQKAQYEVILEGDGTAPAAIQRGVIRIKADTTSPFMLLQRQITRVLVREQGF